jgi:hypothetical protein
MPQRIGRRVGTVKEWKVEGEKGESGAEMHEGGAGWVTHALRLAVAVVGALTVVLLVLQAAVLRPRL